jgi:hypothetical protein
MNKYASMDAGTRRKVFWLLKRLTSYSLWERKRDDWEKFALAYEEAVKTWPPESEEQMPADNLPRIFEILSCYNAGLIELKKGNRSVWLKGQPFSNALRAYWAVSAYLYPHADYWERGMQEAPYPPKVEVLNRLMRSSEYRGEEVPLAGLGSTRGTALIESPGWLLAPSAYQYSFYTLQYPVFPDPLPEVPAGTNTIVRSDRVIPVDGIWEPVKLKRNKVLGLIAVGEPDIISDGCFNYFVKGAKAPKVTGAYRESIDRFDADDTYWRLVWEDDRYKDGVIPDESDYFLEAKLAVEHDEAEVPVARAYELCPISGWWEAVNRESPPVHVLAGALMPDLSIRDAKGEMISHLVTWRLSRRD